MPKPVDEDRARRKRLLEEKRAARRSRAAKEEAAQRLQQQQNQEDSSTDTDVVPAQVLTGDSPLCKLPEVAIHVIYSMLSASDLGRLAMLNQHLFQALTSARISYLLSRLQHDCGMCDSEQAVCELLDNLKDAGGDTGRILGTARGKKQQQQKQVQDECHQFVRYARFLEQAVCGYSTLRCRRDVPLPKFTQGRFVSCSPEHSLARTGGDCGVASGVAAWGVGKRGQLGYGQRRDERVPKRLLEIGYNNSIRIVQVAAGGGLVRVAHSLLLTDTGRVLSFGTGQYGALGHGYNAAKQLPDVLRPKYIEALNHVTIVNVAAGELHSACVTSDGDVYCWGDGFCGQLGLGDKRPQVTPQQITCGGLDEECVANISCGSRHTLAVTEDGEAFSWGLGHFGVLGRSFTPFEYDADAAVVAFATADGGDDDGGDAENQARLRARQRAMGREGEGDAQPQPQPQPQPAEQDAAADLRAHLDLIAKMSLDDASDQCTPKRIDSLDGIKIVGASAGHRHSLLVDCNGNLYSFGAGASGCLGHGDTTTQMYPCRIQAFDEDSTRIMQFSAFVDMSMAVSTAGEVFAWGKTDGGRIGLGMSKSQVTLPRRVYLSNPKNAKATPVDDSSPALKAVDVECGYVHSIIIGLNGTLHMCGGVGVDGEDDGQQQQNDDDDEEQKDDELVVCSDGRPRQIEDFNIWHRLPEPKEVQQVRKKYVKYGKYEIKGRRRNMSGGD